MGIDRAEFRDGIAETREYLLSHHEPSEWYRCYALSVFGSDVRVCARCTGIYPGILVALLVAAFLPFGTPTVALLAVLALPALVDWGYTAFTSHRGYNAVRTLTGALLGYGYGAGVVRFLTTFDVRVLALGAAYALIAGALLAYRARRK